MPPSRDSLRGGWCWSELVVVMSRHRYDSPCDAAVIMIGLVAFRICHIPRYTPPTVDTNRLFWCPVTHDITARSSGLLHNRSRPPSVTFATFHTLKYPLLLFWPTKSNKLSGSSAQRSTFSVIFLRAEANGYSYGEKISPLESGSYFGIFQELGQFSFRLILTFA